MSFIRSASNPEGAYVYDDVRGYVAWCSDGVEWRLPSKHFYAMARAFVRGADKGSFGPLSFREVVYVNGEAHDEAQCMTDCPTSDCEHEHRIEFAFREHGKVEKVYLWRVTWAYIMRNAAKPWPPRKVAKASARKRTRARRSA